MLRDQPSSSCCNAILCRMQPISRQGSSHGVVPFILAILLLLINRGCVCIIWRDRTCHICGDQVSVCDEGMSLRGSLGCAMQKPLGCVGFKRGRFGHFRSKVYSLRVKKLIWVPILLSLSKVGSGKVGYWSYIVWYFHITIVSQFVTLQMTLFYDVSCSSNQVFYWNLVLAIFIRW